LRSSYDISTGGILVLFVDFLLVIFGFGKLNFYDKWKHQEAKFGKDFSGFLA